MPLTPHQRIGSYEIVCALGAGGMGEVYRARDTRLGRDVALKVLPPDVTGEPGRLARFDREARAIAALNHPHIVTIFSTEQDGDIRFLTMELVDGSTLTDLVSSSGMPVARFLDIAMPLADALAAAHHKQITHRDLKPGNVMVSNDGRVKVLDFGLARVGGGEIGEETLTRAPITHHGTIVGTMPYMSPEQVEGHPVDARSDLFSLGVMFYELLGGERPFKGASSPALMSAILRDAPAALADRRADLPDMLTRLVDRLLEKRPEDRVQTARDVFNELKHIHKQLESGSSRSSSASRSAITAAEALSVAVLPFTVRGTDADTEAMAAALTDDITTSLAKFPGHTVIASQATRAFKESPLDVRQIADRLQARYVITGNLRRSGKTLRTTAQLIDARSGEQMWTEHYDRQLDDVFAVQDDLTDHIVATIADRHGVLARSMVKAVQGGTIRGSVSSQLMLHTWGFQHRPVESMHAELRAELESRLAATPNDAHLWAELANMYVVEHSLWFNPLPDPLGRAVRAARRAIELDHANQGGWFWLAVANFHLHDRIAFEEARERAIRINPRNAYAVAWMGNITTHAGDYERGCALTERAMTINPAHPGFLHFAVFNRHIAAGEFEQALHAAKRVNMREFFWMYFAIAAACGQLGRAAEGQAAAAEMVRLAPFLADEANLREFVTRWYWPEEMIETLVSGVANASAARQPDEHPRERSNDRPDSGSGARTKPPSSHAEPSIRGGALTVAVLPFETRSSDAIAGDLADGLAEEIANGLSRFGHVRVVRGQRATGRNRYSLEGQIRSTASMVRVSVRLVDAATGETIWTQNFDREGGGDFFALQDDIANRVVSTVGDPAGVLARATLAALAEVPADQLSVGELVLRYHAYTGRFNAEEHSVLRDAFERALEKEPRSAEGWACLAHLYRHEYSHGYNPLPDSLTRHRRAAARATQLDPNSQMAWVALAAAHLFARDGAGVRVAVDRALELNPLDGVALSLCALYLSCIGDARGEQLATRALELKPQQPGWIHVPAFAARFARGEYDEALAKIKLMNMPRFAYGQIAEAATAGLLGKADAARTALRTIREYMPDIADPVRARDELAKWMWDESFMAKIDEGFRKALALEEGSEARSSAAGADHRSVAVLPFTDLSEKKDQDWFCDGIAEEIMTALAGLPGLRVAARASAFSFRGKADDLEAIGEKLNVTTVLEGSVRRAGDRVRITTRLSDAQLGRQLWTERFDRELRDIFDIQEEIARAVADRLRISITGGSRLVQQATTNLEAYQLLLQGRTLLTRRGRAIFDAIPFFQRAIALDANLSEAHALLGDACRLLGLYGLAPASEVMPKARACIDRALAIDPEQPEALASTAIIATVFEWNLRECLRRSDRALQADPNHVRANTERALSLGFLGQPDHGDWQSQARAHINKARTLDPLNAWVMASDAALHIMSGAIERGTSLARAAIDLDANNFTAYWYYTWGLAELEQDEAAIAACEAALAMSGRHPQILSTLSAIHASRGRRDAADTIHAELTARAESGFVGRGARASVAASSGRLDEARTLLAAAIAEHDPYVPFFKMYGWRHALKDETCAAMIRATSLFSSTQK